MERKRIGDWEMKIGSVKSVQKEIVGKLEIFLDEWKKVVWDIDCPWWSVENLGIQSPLVRIDMAPITEVDDSNVKNFVYEVEVRPAGMGLALSLFSKKRVKQWREALCNCNGFINIRSSIQDDGLAAKILKIPYYSYEDDEDEKISINRDNPPYWIRTNKRKGQLFKDLEKISLVPIRLDGDKRCLVKLGMAKTLTSHYLSQLNWMEPFVVKPLIGARTAGVEIFLPSFLKKKFGQGGSTQTRVRRTIESAEMSYIVQRFIPPQIEVIDDARGCTIWRLFFTWEEEKYKFAGGLWNWRPNIRVHGSSDSVFGIVDL